MSGPYDVLMVDPPWPLLSIPATSQWLAGAGKRVGLPYKAEPLDAIWRMLDADVFSRLTDRATVFLWTLDRFLFSSEQEMDRRGYQRHARLIWDKGESGLSPCATLRFCHEYLLWFYRPPFSGVVTTAQGKFTTIIRGNRREHSRKPSAAYTMVEALYPDARKLDAFSREWRQGWDAMGDQIDHFSPLFACLREGAS